LKISAAAARVVELGFAEVRAYLEDRLIGREWLLAEVAAELSADRRTVRRLMQQAGVTRGRRTARQLAVGERGRRVQSVSWQQRRAARLEELALRTWAGTCSAGAWSRSGRSSGCGPSLGWAAAGW
jgi:hypothetical protein